MDCLITQMIKKVSILILHETDNRGRSIYDVCKFAVLQLAFMLHDTCFKFLTQPNSQYLDSLDLSRAVLKD